MNLLNRQLYICFFLFSLTSLFSQISFTSVDINNKNDVLFTIRTSTPGKSDYTTLFKKKVDSSIIEQLTFYPESLHSYDQGRILQIQNRFGTGRFNTKTNEFSFLSYTKPFVYGGIPNRGHIDEIATSPNGKWIIFIEPISAALGKLVLFDTVKQVSFVIAPSVERGSLPVSWAPDSSLLLYSLENSIYFARPDSFFTKTLVDKKYRKLGSGSINSIDWISDAQFIYVSNTSVYQVSIQELFARSLYAPLIQIGTLIGKLPSSFSNFADSISVSKDGKTLLYLKDNRNIFLCALKGDDYTSSYKPNLPYFLLPGSTSHVSFCWNETNQPIIFTESIENGHKNIKAWKLEKLAGVDTFIQLLLPKDSQTYSISKNGALIAFNTHKGLYVYSTKTWKEVSSFFDEQIISFDWASDSMLFLGGETSIRIWNVQNKESTVVILSSADKFSWSEQENDILLETTNLGKFTYKENMIWELSPSKKMQSNTMLNPFWRMYIDRGSEYFDNMIFARSAISPGGTYPLIEESKLDIPSYIKQTKSTDKRLESKNIALIFDAMEGVEGLAKILSSLELFQLECSFFVNGEFIRQHPEAVNEIVKAGHQVGSLFFTTWNLTDSDYSIDEDFIIRGLARNEDDFFNTTGKELSLIWHTPYYYNSPIISKAGEKSGYRTISPDIFVADWITIEQDKQAPGLYQTTSDIIDSILQNVKTGSIIPIRIGKEEGHRDDYLFDKLPILLNALIDAGFNITSIGSL